MPQLNVSVVSAGTSTYNLTTLGTADWIVYPGASPVRKNGGGSQIAVSHIGSFSDSVATDSKEMSTWSDGAGTTSGSTNSLIFSSAGDGIGYAITFPADVTTRVATVIAGVYNTRLRITVSLSDNSAPQVVDTSIISDSSGGNPAAITITYAAGSANQTLTVSAVQIAPSGYANTSFQSAAMTTQGAIALSPGTGSISLASYAPTVARGVTTAVAPSPGTLAFATYSPTVTQTLNTAVMPGTATLQIAGYAPTIAQTNSITLNPAAATLQLTGYAPTVLQRAPVVSITVKFNILPRNWGMKTVHFSS